MNDQSGDTAKGGARHYVDTSPIPAWGSAEDGAAVRIVADAVLEADFAAWQAGECRHPDDRQFTGKTLDTLGRALFKRYCKDCGIATTSALPHLSVSNTNIDPIDTAKRDTLVDQYTGQREASLRAIADRAASRLQPEQRADYSEYLNSPEWHGLRAAIMDRCGGLCEGCRKQDAHDVHHLTYAHIRNEFLFELVGLCRDCHTRWHAQD